jgi:hypothetical protein
MRAAGIIAALSPNTRWEVNIAAAAEFYRDQSASLHVYTQMAKATLIYGGAEPVDVLRGPKELAFYRNISDPAGSTAVTVDRHAARAALGWGFSIDEISLRLGRVRVYGKVAESYRRLAAGIGLVPCQLQAIIWLVYRREFADIDSIPF